MMIRSELCRVIHEDMGLDDFKVTTNPIRQGPS